jgi:hypothetical protein
MWALFFLALMGEEIVLIALIFILGLFFPAFSDAVIVGAVAAFINYLMSGLVMWTLEKFTMERVVENIFIFSSIILSFVITYHLNYQMSHFDKYLWLAMAIGYFPGGLLLTAIFIDNLKD